MERGEGWEGRRGAGYELLIAHQHQEIRRSGRSNRSSAVSTWRSRRIDYRVKAQRSDMR